MIAQIGLTVLLLWVIAYAWAEYRRAPLIGTVAVLVATAGLYFVWLPAHASWLAAFVGIGRGVDLILYVWLVISLTCFSTSISSCGRRPRSSLRSRAR
jgi:hypothetical protein